MQLWMLVLPLVGRLLAAGQLRGLNPLLFVALALRQSALPFLRRPGAAGSTATWVSPLSRSPEQLDAEGVAFLTTAVSREVLSLMLDLLMAAQSVLSAEACCQVGDGDMGWVGGWRDQCWQNDRGRMGVLLTVTQRTVLAFVFTSLFLAA